MSPAAILGISIVILALISLVLLWAVFTLQSRIAVLERYTAPIRFQTNHEAGHEEQAVLMTTPVDSLTAVES